MCANLQFITLAQANLLTSQQLRFDFKDDVYPTYDTPLLFAIQNGLEPQWGQVRFGLIPKWADSTDITKYSYNARFETVMEKPSYRDAWYKSQFTLIPVQTVYEPYYENRKSQRWGIYHRDGHPFRAFFRICVAAIYEVARILILICYFRQ